MPNVEKCDGLDEAVEVWIGRVQEMLNEHYAKHFPVLAVPKIIRAGARST